MVGVDTGRYHQRQWVDWNYRFPLDFIQLNTKVAKGRPHGKI